MLLAIDSGNTNSVFCVFQDDSLIAQWRFSTNLSKTSDEFMMGVDAMLKLKGLSVSQIKDVMIATVVPSCLFFLKKFCQDYFNFEPILIPDNQKDFDIKIDVDYPKEVGTDRLLNAVAAYHIYKSAAIVVDFGTATTFDVISHQGAYMGGVIAPGVDLSLEALHQAADKLPRVDIVPSQKVVGRNTSDAMKSGIFWGYVSLIDGLIIKMRKENPDLNFKVISTGGLSYLFSSSCETIECHNENLTMWGLYLMYKKMKGI